MRVWGLVSQKGGSGRTCNSIHLAVHAAAQGERVLVLDLDIQESAMAFAAGRKEEEPEFVACTPDKLAAALEAAKEAGCTLAVLDTAPHVDRGALAAINQSTLIVMPVRP